MSGAKRSGGPRPRPLAERFVERYEPRECGHTTPCWVWTGPLNNSGYGVISRGMRGGARVAAHRVAYELHVGPIPLGLEMDHLCRNPACVNPTHIEPVTRRENQVRGVGFVAKAVEKTHCKHGHPFDERNTYIAKNGTRHCRACGREYARRKHQAAKALAT